VSSVLKYSSQAAASVRFPHFASQLLNANFLSKDLKRFISLFKLSSLQAAEANLPASLAGSSNSYGKQASSMGAEIEAVQLGAFFQSALYRRYAQLTKRKSHQGIPLFFFFFDSFSELVFSMKRRRNDKNLPFLLHSSRSEVPNFSPLHQKCLEQLFIAFLVQFEHLVRVSRPFDGRQPDTMQDPEVSSEPQMRHFDANHHSFNSELSLFASISQSPAIAVASLNYGKEILLKLCSQFEDVPYFLTDYYKHRLYPNTDVLSVQSAIHLLQFVCKETEAAYVYLTLANHSRDMFPLAKCGN
jgi:hypothetical protein